MKHELWVMVEAYKGLLPDNVGYQIDPKHLKQVKALHPELFNKRAQDIKSSGAAVRVAGSAKPVPPNAVGPNNLRNQEWRRQRKQKRQVSRAAAVAAMRAAQQAARPKE
jgi:hypothetical protein